MKILSIAECKSLGFPFCFFSARRQLEQGELRVWIAKVDSLPDDVCAIVATSDLQARDSNNDELLGSWLAPEFANTCTERGLPPKEMGVFLAGDFYAMSSERGGIGDVRQVWKDFRSEFKWVVGVAGNHDSFGNCTEGRNFGKGKGSQLLDGQLVEVGGLRVGGIGGIIGKTSKHLRKSDVDFCRMLRSVLEKDPNVLILHQPPSLPKQGLHGDVSIRKELLRSEHPVLIVCGHNEWKLPLVGLSNSVQVLNVNMRIVLLVDEIDEKAWGL